MTNYDPFPFVTSLDAEYVGDRMAREMTRGEAEAAIDAAYAWILKCRERHLASRWGREGDGDE